MAQVMSQTPLITVRQMIDTGALRNINLLTASNYTGSAVVIKVYLVPNRRESSTITDHLFWIISCAANSTHVLDLTSYRVSLGKDTYHLEAEAASDSAITLTVLGS